MACLFIFPAVVGLISAVFQFCWWKNRPTPAAHCTTAHPAPSLSLSYSLTVSPYPPPKREHFSPELSVFIRKRGEVQSEKGRGATLSYLLQAATIFRVSSFYSFSPCSSLHSSMKYFLLVALVYSGCVWWFYCNLLLLCSWPVCLLRTMAYQSICVALLLLLIGHMLAGKSPDWVSVRMDNRRMGKVTHLQKRLHEFKISIS